ncbi:MAG: phosphate ABC transporter permease PstA [Fimbriimonadaceae bacterium]|nr:phosphate ABC transporter permease PstA [Fimbriimonadaceae bacterium]
MATLSFAYIPSRELLALRDAARMRKSRLYTSALSIVGVATALLILGLIMTILFKGAPAMSWQFLTSPPVDGMTAGGIGPMVRGSLLLMGGTLLLVLPLGIFGGIFLAEYVGRCRVAAFFNACVSSLAATPSIIYGLFGLAVFVLLFDFKISLLSGWLTLAFFALPVIVLTTENAIKNVPDSLIEASLALGLTRWQTIRKVVLPNAMPGILSGMVLMTGRAAGEAPPILFTAGIYYSTAQLGFSKDTLFQPVANLPYHLAEGYRQGGVIPEKTIWGTCLTLMMLVLVINLGAIILRSRMRWKLQG